MENTNTCSLNFNQKPDLDPSLLPPYLLMIGDAILTFLFPDEKTTSDLIENPFYFISHFCLVF
jgi:hypothetical protein